MATIKAYTDLEQSRKLAEILPIESADMRYGYIAPYDFSDRMYDDGYDSIPYIKDFFKVNPDFSENEYDGELPCWSLAALFGVLPQKYYPIKDHETNLTLGKPKDKWCVLYWDTTGMQDDEQTFGNNLIDACYEMIVKLHEQKLL